jgi:hypothetical protein
MWCCDAGSGPAGLVTSATPAASTLVTASEAIAAR